MDVERLISALVRQTTVLVARLSTAGGARSPLAHVANQVFLGLVTELERQGVGKKVAADMFGLALRSYQLKLQRLQESASEGGVTLWSALRSFIEQRGAVSRSDIAQRFRHDDEASVRGILNDLVESGLVYRTGRGDGCIYRVTPRDDLAALAERDSLEAAAALVWLAVCQNGPLDSQAIASATNLRVSTVGSALERLLADGRVRASVSTPDGGETYSADRCLIPIGDAAGWEAALLDHHQAVLNALAAKIGAGARGSKQRDETGGATYRFELWPGHPDEDDVRSLLSRFRVEAAGLWDRVSAYNTRSQGPEQARFGVVFYLGQHLQQEDEEA
jgi:predicted transcriptional regulator